MDLDASDALSRHWWIRTRWILDQIELDHAIEIWKLQREQHLTAIGRVEDNQAFQQHWKAANDLSVNIYNALFPWNTNDRAMKTSIEQMREQWVKTYGDPCDPAVQKRIAETVAKIKERIQRGQDNQQRQFDTSRRERENMERTIRPGRQGRRSRRR